MEDMRNVMTLQDVEEIIKGESIATISWEDKLKLMNHHEDFKEPFGGKNENGENVLVSINKDNITCETFQSNGYIRINVFYRDGMCEELFDK